MAKAPSKQEILKHALTDRIRTGVYTAKLPGMQALAEEFSVNVKTVNKAVRALVTEGLVENRGPRGTYVAERSSGPLRVPAAWTEIDTEIYARARRGFAARSAMEVVSDEGEPEVLKVNAGAVAMLAERLLPLDDLATDGFLSRLMPEAVKCFTYDGRLYGVPLTVSPYLLYYSVERMAALGLARPGPFGSLDDFLKLCTRLVEDAGAKYPYAAYGRFTYILPFLWQSGAELLDADGLHGRLDAPEVRTVFEFYAELRARSVPGLGQHEFRPALEALLSGELAMMGWGGWMESWLESEPRGRFGVAPIEIAGRRQTLLFSEGYAIARDAAHPDEAWRFIEAIFSPEAQECFVRTGAQIPAWREGVRPAPKMFVDMLADSGPGGRRIPIEVIDLVTAEWESFLEGAEPYDDFAARVSPALEVLLAHIEREREWAKRAIKAAPGGPDPRHWGGA